LPFDAGTTSGRRNCEVSSAQKRGYDAHKKVGGHKRYIAVDTDGCLLAVNLTPAGIAGSTGVYMVLDALAKRWSRVKHLFGDAAYHRQR
jgi:hypothetical protein